MNEFLEFEMHQVRWNDFREILGGAANIERSLTRFLNSTSVDEVNSAYWNLDNHVVVDGIVYSSAEPVLTILVAAFATPLIRPTKIASLDLIYQVLTGWPHPDQRESGGPDLIDHCRDRVREGLWTFIFEAVNGVGEAALDVIELVDQARAGQVRAWFGDRPIPGASSDQGTH